MVWGSKISALLWLCSWWSLIRTAHILGQFSFISHNCNWGTLSSILVYFYVTYLFTFKAWRTFYPWLSLWRSKHGWYMFYSQLINAKMQTDAKKKIKNTPTITFGFFHTFCTSFFFLSLFLFSKTHLFSFLSNPRLSLLSCLPHGLGHAIRKEVRGQISQGGAHRARLSLNMEIIFKLSSTLKKGYETREKRKK